MCVTIALLLHLVPVALYSDQSDLQGQKDIIHCFCSFFSFVLAFWVGQDIKELHIFKTHTHLHIYKEKITR